MNIPVHCDFTLMSCFTLSLFCNGRQTCVKHDRSWLMMMFIVCRVPRVTTFCSELCSTEVCFETWQVFGRWRACEELIRVSSVLTDACFYKKVCYECVIWCVYQILRILKPCGVQWLLWDTLGFCTVRRRPSRSRSLSGTETTAGSLFILIIFFLKIRYSRVNAM